MTDPEPTRARRLPGGAADALLRDLRHAARSLRRSPGFALPVLLTLALGVAAGGPVLGVVGAGWRRPLPTAAPAPLDPVGGRLAWTEAARTVARIRHDAVDALLAILLGLAAVGVGLACVNLAILLLSRAAARRHEMAVRAALGAGRGRLAGQLLAEGALLAAVGAAVGVGLGTVGAALVRGSWPEGLARFVEAGAALPAVGLAAGVLAATVLLFGMSPAGAASRRALGGVLAAGGRATAGPLEAKVRNGLMVVGVACSLVLLVATGLLVRGSAPVAEGGAAGLDPRDTLVMRVDLRGAAPADAGERAALLGRMLAQVRGAPGARGASLSSEGAWVGLGTEDRVRAFCLECWRGYVSTPVWDGAARHHAVTPGFFRAHGVGVLGGREFTPADSAGAPRVVVISRNFAYRLFPNRDPLGRKVRVGGGDNWYTVVGIVPDLRPRGLGSSGEPMPALYMSALQHPPASVGVAVRTTGDPLRLEGAVRAALHGAAPGARVREVGTMAGEMERFAAPLRWFGMLFGVLAAVAVVLAGMGVYGVMSYNVARRTREVGVRMALGAQARSVVALIVGTGVRLTVVGMVLGLWGALSLARLLELRFHGVDSLDLPVYAGVAALLGGVAVAGSWLPARRAAGVDPVVALRVE